MYLHIFPYLFPFNLTKRIETPEGLKKDFKTTVQPCLRDLCGQKLAKDPGIKVQKCTPLPQDQKMAFEKGWASPKKAFRLPKNRSIFLEGSSSKGERIVRWIHFWREIREFQTEPLDWKRALRAPGILESLRMLNELHEKNGLAEKTKKNLNMLVI